MDDEPRHTTRRQHRIAHLGCFWLATIPPEHITQHHSQPPVAARLNWQRKEIEQRVLTRAFGQARDDSGIEGDGFIAVGETCEPGAG